MPDEGSATVVLKTAGNLETRCKMLQVLFKRGPDVSFEAIRPDRTISSAGVSHEYVLDTTVQKTDELPVNP